MHRKRLLFINTKEIISDEMTNKLILEGYKCKNAEQNSITFKILLNVDVLILGSTFQKDKKIFNLIKKIREYKRTFPIILVNKFSSEEKIISVLQANGMDYLIQPIVVKDLLNSINCLNVYDENSFKKCIHDDFHSELNQSLIGTSRSMSIVKDQIKKAGFSDAPVMITGETGSGKELVAHWIHKFSERWNKPLICVNCAALPTNLVESELFGYERGAFTGALSSTKGKFELANLGVLFLDEIGDMRLISQIKILRAIETKEIYRIGGKEPIKLDIRIISASNQNIEKLVDKNKFREDLYYRLNIIRIYVPPLRERKEDIPHLVSHFIRVLNNKYGLFVENLSEKSVGLLFKHSWPGNIRELKNYLEASFVNILTNPREMIDLLPQIEELINQRIPETLNNRDRFILELNKNNWNKSKTAKILNISRQTLYRKIDIYNIDTQLHLIQKELNKT